MILQLSFFLFSFASYENIKVGKIDSYYKKNLNENILRNIIKEVEADLEKQFGKDLFNYSTLGKPIDILYLPPSKIELKINENIKRYELLKNDIDRMKKKIQENEKIISLDEKELLNKGEILNKRVSNLNEFIKVQNKRKNINKDEYIKINKIINEEKKSIDIKKKDFKSNQNKFNKLIDEHNKYISKHNKYIFDLNKLSNEIESLNRNYKKIKGKAFGIVETTTKTIIKNGKINKQTNHKTTAQKIEIYGFDSLNELKVIIAHEILHLLGAFHIEKKGALMNPILQENQLIKLQLTKDDIKVLKRVLNQ